MTNFLVLYQRKTNRYNDLCILNNEQVSIITTVVVVYNEHAGVQRRGTEESQRNVCKMPKVLSSLPKWYPQTSIHDKTCTSVCLEKDNSKNSQLI